MKNRSKALLLALCALMLVVTTVFTTLAYLTDDATITNTFTIGNVTIKLTETKTNEYGVAVDPEVILDADTDEGNEYKLIPGANYLKNPTITVKEKSEPSYVFVKVENGIAGIEADGATKIETQILANGWTAVDGQPGVYVQENVDARNADQPLPVFSTVKLATNANVAGYADAEITITAYAIQAEGVVDVATAWAALNA